MKIIKVTEQIKCSNKEAKMIAKLMYRVIEKNKYIHLSQTLGNAKIKTVSMTITDYVPKRKRLKNTK